MKLSRDVKLGARALGVIIAVAVGSLMLGKSRLGDQAEITGVFSQSQLLARGNDVIYRGVKIGKVQKIGLSPRNDGVYVTMRIKPGMHFPPDAAVLIEPQALMGDWQVQVISRSWHPELEFAHAADSTILPGAFLASLTELTSVASRLEGDIDTLSASFTPAKVAQIHRTVDQAESLSEQLREITGKQSSTLDRSGGGILANSERVKAMTLSARAMAQGMRDSVAGGAGTGGMIASARAASANLAAFSEQLAGMAGRSGATLRAADASLTSVQRMSESMGRSAAAMAPRVASAGTSLQGAQQAIRALEQTMAQAQQGGGALARLVNDPAAYQQTLKAVADLRRMLDDLQAHPERYIGKGKSR